MTTDTNLQVQDNSGGGVYTTPKKAVEGVTFDPINGIFYDANDNPLDFRFYPKKRLFVTSGGYEVRFHPINMNTVFMFTDAVQKKYAPEMPQRAVEYDEGKYYMTGNDKDPAYVKALADYEQILGIKVMQFIVNVSVLNKIPPKKEWSEAFSILVEMQETEPDERLMKYLWINHHLLSVAETEIFSRIVQGQNMPTRDGIEAAERRFQNNGQ